MKQCCGELNLNRSLGTACRVVGEYGMVFDELKDNPENLWQDMDHMDELVIGGDIIGVLPEEMEISSFRDLRASMDIACVADHIQEMYVDLQPIKCILDSLAGFQEVPKNHMECVGPVHRVVQVLSRHSRK